jgi:adenylylsulfate kinase-like enzyme
MNLVKGLFMNCKHETLELRGTGEVGNIHVVRISNILKKWGYVEIVHIGTFHRRYHSLNVTVKKTEDFEKIYVAYRAERAEAFEEKKKLEREAKAAEEKNAPGEMPELESRESDEVVVESTLTTADSVIV